jgi:lysophospholipase L1-like esterase
MSDNLFQRSPEQASFVALGDSFTEGLNDTDGLDAPGGLRNTAPGGAYRGWADRLAVLLAAEYPGLRYANLAVRGKLLRQIVADQVPVAAAMSPGLVSIAGGGNDILRPGADPDTLAELFDAAVARLQAAGSRVLLFTGFDPVRFPLLRLLRGRIAAYNMHLRAIADARDCYLVDLWSMRFLRETAAWSPDRIHLSAQSHQRVALRAAEVLGVPLTEDWRGSVAAGAVTAGPVADGAVPAGAVSAGPVAAGTVTVNGARRTVWLAARREDARWAKEYLAPWVNRRLHGTSSGDGLSAKRPVLEVVAPSVVS